MPNGLDNTELELHRELWMWRGFAVLLLVILIVSTLTTYLSDVRQHALDNAERAAAWTRIEAGLKLNGERIQNVDNRMQQCTRCHNREERR